VLRAATLDRGVRARFKPRQTFDARVSIQRKETISDAN
jgi:hypothetical protein